MEVEPPRYSEAVVRWLLPPASVEHVLGDLQERMQGVDPRAARRQYIVDAIVTVPSVIFSRVLCSLDLRLVCLYILIQYAAFMAFALLNLHRHGIQLTVDSLVKFWWFTTAIVAFKLVADSYRLLNVIYIAVSTYVIWSTQLPSALMVGYFVGYQHLLLGGLLFEKYFAGPRNRKTS